MTASLAGMIHSNPSSPVYPVVAMNVWADLISKTLLRSIGIGR
jgi:hypothetical protein